MDPQEGTQESLRKTDFIPSRVLERAGMPFLARLNGEASARSGGRSQERRQVWPGLASLSNSSGLLATDLIPGCTASGPGVIKAQKYCFLHDRGQIEEIWLWIH